MTLRGLIVTLIELFLLVFAFGTEMHEFLIVALCLGVLEIYSFVSILLASVTLSLRSRLDINNVERLGGANYTLAFRGVALLPVAGYISIKNADFEDKKLKRRKHSFVMLPSFVVEHKFNFHMPCVHVGAWQVGVKKLRIEDLFGLFSFPLLRSRKSKFLTLYVLPKVYKLATDYKTVSLGDYGMSSIKSSEEGELLGDSRVYIEGDALKRINWKLSARTKTLHSRQFEMLQNPKIIIAVDTAVNGEAFGDIIDIACESAVSVADYFLKSGHAVDVIFLRGKDGVANKSVSLVKPEDIFLLQYNFTGVEFYKDEQPLEFMPQDNAEIVTANKVFVVSSNPSGAVLSDVVDMCQSGKLARCIIPSDKTEQPDEEEEKIDTLAIRIFDARQIEKKVGGAL